MLRSASLLIAVLVVLTAGLAHGVWTNRWQPSSGLEAAVERMQTLPDEIGDWHGVEQHVAKDELGLAGADGWWIRRFTSQRTQQTVVVMLLCGRMGQMSVHRPENCYSAAGYELAAQPLPYTLRNDQDKPLGQFWTARFVKQESVGKSELRILWSWLAGDHWLGPRYPRWTFAREPYLYKLYVIRDATFRPDKLDNDPAVEFMRQLVPVLTLHLAPEQS